MKKYYIFLDDVRYPNDVKWVKVPMHPYVIIRTYDNFVEYINNRDYLPSFICYDHDLNDVHYGDGQNGNKIDYSKYVEKTGYDCAKWLVEKCISLNLPHPPYIVHSLNPVGKQNIINCIESYNATRNKQ